MNLKTPVSFTEAYNAWTYPCDLYFAMKIKIQSIRDAIPGRLSWIHHHTFFIIEFEPGIN